MKLNIGQKLREYRRARNLTQDEVAQHLGIAFQSISKWERGEGYPDITMLPPLARYFGVSVDELLDMHSLAAAEEYAALNRQWEENRQCGEHRANVELMREALRSYPNDPLLLVQLSASLERLDGSPEEKRENLRRSIQVQEQIINHCPDSEIRGAVMFNLSNSYLKYGDRAKALEYAEKLPNLYKARENALVRILEDDAQRREVAKAALEPLLWSLNLHLTTLGKTEKASQIAAILRS